MYTAERTRRSESHPRGSARIGIVGLLVAIVSVVVLFAILAVLARSARTKHSIAFRDASQLRGIHQSFLVFSREFDGLFPTPGLINRVGNVPGRGEVDRMLDHTAPLYSSAIASNYFGPELLISPAEPTDHVRVMGFDSDEYNWDAYNPAGDVFWDSNFVMRIDDPAIGANASYAHLTLTCAAVETEWRESLNPESIILATRGPRNGTCPGDPNHDRSPTTQFFKPYNVWVGNVVRGDNSTDGLVSAADDPDMVKNIFSRSEHWLSISTSVVKTEDGFDVVDVYDPLDPQ